MIGQYWSIRLFTGLAIHSLLHATALGPLLDASATMATTDLVGPAIGFVAFASVMLCLVGWKRGWCYTEGESGEMRRLLNLRLAERYL